MLVSGVGVPFINQHERMRAAFAQLEESKVVSFYPFMVSFRSVVRPIVLAFSCLAFLAAALPAAYAQSFAITTTTLQPGSVDPGGSATATVAVTTSGGFDNTVIFTCTVTSSQVTTNLPTCLVSPSSEIPPANPSLTVMTSSSTTAGTYQITVTGTSGATVVNATPLYLNVTDLAVDYTITAFPTTAVPSPVVAGSIATTTVTVAPIGSYTGTVTLSCLSVTPVVLGAPVCTFNPPTVTVSTGEPPTSMLTLTTFNTPVTPTTAKRWQPRALYALWLGIPALVFAGWGDRGKRRRRLLGIFLLLGIASGLLLLPACGTSSTNNANNQITPNETYTFTVTGSDQNGAGPSSTSSSTVTLQVNGTS